MTKVARAHPVVWLLVGAERVGYRAATMTDFSTLSMTEIIRLQNLLQQELTRRFERPLAIAFSDIVASTPYFARFGDAAGRQLQQLHIDLLNECLPQQQGRVVDTAGDGAFLAFPSADAAIVALEHEVCTGCHMKVTTQTAHHVKNGKEIVSCEQCGRILYWAD